MVRVKNSRRVDTACFMPCRHKLKCFGVNQAFLYLEGKIVLPCIRQCILNFQERKKICFGTFVTRNYISFANDMKMKYLLTSREY